jgi:hypothetical protein
VLAAKAAEIVHGDDFSKVVTHRAILRHAVLVRGGRCLRRERVDAFRVEPCVLKARNVSIWGLKTAKARRKLDNCMTFLSRILAQKAMNIGGVG